MIEISERFNIVEKQQGRYSAFPTLMRVDDVIWLACRQGVTDKERPHGDNGQVFLYYATVSDLQSWSGVAINFDQSYEHPNDLDAIITRISNDKAVLLSRHYQADDDNYPYISELPLSQLREVGQDNRRLQLPRRKLNESIVQSEVGVKVAACYGHIVQKQNDLLMTTYATLSNEQMHSPVILRSNDEGKSWSLHSQIASSDQCNRYLNENTIIQLPDGLWLSVIRAGEQPFPLYCAISDQYAKNWQPIQETGLFGHSPILVHGEDRQVLLLYRDLSQTKPRISLAEYAQGKFHDLGTISEYENTYNGGYGDLIALGEDRYLVVEYMDDEDACPWIEGFILKINQTR